MAGPHPPVRYLLILVKKSIYFLKIDLTYGYICAPDIKVQLYEQIKSECLISLYASACCHGDRFLNDLLDADVLIHIVDVSGTTDEHGEQTTGYNPAADITWLQQELQLVCTGLCLLL